MKNAAIFHLELTSVMLPATSVGHLHVLTMPAKWHLMLILLPGAVLLLHLQSLPITYALNNIQIIIAERLKTSIKSTGFYMAMSCIK